jgi:molybdopterin converting factor small subunit
MLVEVDVVSAVPLGPEKGPVILELPEGSKVSNLVQALIDRFGEEVKDRLVQKKDGKPFVSFIRNGEQVDLDSLLVEGDHLLILPPIGGG